LVAGPRNGARRGGGREQRYNAIASERNEEKQTRRMLHQYGRGRKGRQQSARRHQTGCRVMARGGAGMDNAHRPPRPERKVDERGEELFYQRHQRSDGAVLSAALCVKRTAARKSEAVSTSQTCPVHGGEDGGNRVRCVEECAACGVRKEAAWWWAPKDGSGRRGRWRRVRANQL